MSARPPAVALWLLDRLVTGPNRDALLGDLIERHALGKPNGSSRKRSLRSAPRPRQSSARITAWSGGRLLRGLRGCGGPRHREDTAGLPRSSWPCSITSAARGSSRITARTPCRRRGCGRPRASSPGDSSPLGPRKTISHRRPQRTGAPPASTGGAGQISRAVRTLRTSTEPFSASPGKRCWRCRPNPIGASCSSSCTATARRSKRCSARSSTTCTDGSFASSATDRWPKTG